jgi:phospholipase C
MSTSPIQHVVVLMLENHSFDNLLALSGIPRLIAAGSGIELWDMNDLSGFAADLQGTYPWAYTFIEPNYGDVINGSYAGGSSQHPMDGVARGEAVLKQIYDALRSSPL